MMPVTALLEDNPPDLVLSGINFGPKLGNSFKLDHINDANDD